MIPAHDGTLHVAIGKAAECQMMGLTTAASFQTVIATRFYAERLDSGLKSSADFICPEGGFRGLQRWLGTIARPGQGKDGDPNQGQTHLREGEQILIIDKAVTPDFGRYHFDAERQESHAGPVMSTAKAELTAPTGDGSQFA